MKAARGRRQSGGRRGAGPAPRGARSRREGGGTRQSRRALGEPGGGGGGELRQARGERRRAGGAGTGPPPSRGRSPPGNPRRTTPPLPGESREPGGPGAPPRRRARRPGSEGPGGQRYLTAPGAIPLPRRLPPHRRAAAGSAPRPCLRERRGGRRGLPRPRTSPFVSGCSSSVRLGLATRVSLAGREAEVLQQQLLNRQWLP